jgi:hypothetical protein
MSEWDNINDVKGWSSKLGELLTEAKKAALQDELEPRLIVNERLMQFIENSWPNTPEIEVLDEIANQTASALLNQTIEERLQSITMRTGEYQKLSKNINALTEENSAKADSIRLKAIIGFIDSLTNTVEVAKSLQKSLKTDGADAELSNEITEMIVAVEKIRSNAGKRF